MPRAMACFTMIQDEPVFLPVWLKYYATQFRECDLYVLDHVMHGGTDHAPTVRAYGANYIAVHNEKSFDHLWMLDIVRHFQRFLLLNYTSVLFSEVDEIIVGVGKSLKKFILGNTDAVVRPMGLNVFHDRAKGEPPMDWSKPIMAQRSVGYIAPRYSKPLLGREPIDWDIGFHGAVKNPSVCPDLIDCHLHRADFDYCMERHQRAVKRKWSQYDREKGFGVQYMIEDPKAIEGWFMEGSDRGTDLMELTPELKGAF